MRFRSLNAGRSIHQSAVGSFGLTTIGSRLCPCAVSGTGMPLRTRDDIRAPSTLNPLTELLGPTSCLRDHADEGLYQL